MKLKKKINEEVETLREPEGEGWCLNDLLKKIERKGFVEILNFEEYDIFVY